MNNSILELLSYFDHSLDTMEADKAKRIAQRYLNDNLISLEVYNLVIGYIDDRLKNN